MVDFDLAMLYGVQNKRLNEQVKRNIKRFPDDFMFQLTKEEWNILKSQIATAKQTENKTITLLRSQFATTKDISKIRTLPYAFTREGIGMLSVAFSASRVWPCERGPFKIIGGNILCFAKYWRIGDGSLIPRPVTPMGWQKAKG